MSSLYLNMKEIMKWQEDANRKIESIAKQLESIDKLVTNNLSGSEASDSIMELLEIISSIEVQQKNFIENANSIKVKEVQDMSDELKFHIQLLEKDLELLNLENNS
ncbi:uncharacterized protein LOC129608833 [Condylostylus longicornis]|uniref:uncharacterized protein LOC129608833 n=1 Tax=Condylostylus longicornis TaxID=2530218 RepID=UPI00244DCCE1|nr:uncharacterized protein LOC129608833 [Condylostylus longicornis]